MCSENLLSVSRTLIREILDLMWCKNVNCNSEIYI